MVSAHMLNKTSLSKPLFKEISQSCSTIVILQILEKKSFKHLFGVPANLFLKQFVIYYHCFFENFEPLITQAGEL